MTTIFRLAFHFLLFENCFFRILSKENGEIDHININCVDPLGRSALLMAIDNENLEMVELLINYNVDTKDALLHAISEEFVEAVEMLLDHEDANQTKEGHVSDRRLSTIYLSYCFYYTLMFNSFLIEAKGKFIFFKCCFTCYMHPHAVHTVWCT